MKYYSTNNKLKLVSFKEAVISGIAPDNGLYMPQSIGFLDENIYRHNNFRQMCFEIARILIDGEIPEDKLRQITDDSFNFDVPVKNINDNIFVLELFHGPTMAFKDFGARFMARTMSYFIENIDRKLTILVATSGDTGSAVAKGFYDVPNIDVVILYPKNKVSFLQEKQLTTLGRNITALEVKGTFDDCQRMVKEAFLDKELNSRLVLSSANSINIARLFPQSFYYIWAYNRILEDTKKNKVIFCTPSGNFGNLTGGLIAKRMGLPVELFIAATNINDVVPEYLETGFYSPKSSIQTYSNAMDVGNPSNFARMQDLYSSREDMTKDIIGFKVTDGETLDVIKDVYLKYGYILDPHGAVGYKAILDYLGKFYDHSIPIILLETAHPAKFGDTIRKAIGIDIEIPDNLKEALRKEKKSIEIENNVKGLKKFLFERYR